MSLVSRLLRRWKTILLVSASAFLLFAILGVPYLLAVLITRAGTRPMDLELTSSPADYGLSYQEVAFSAADGAPLSGWLLSGGTRRAVVAVGHGLFRSRREVLDRAAFFRQQGYDTLVFDFRRHGGSGGEQVSLGYHERKDFEGANELLRKMHPGAPVVLYGVSMGAGAAILAARETPQVAAVVADSPFLNLEHTVVHHVKLIFGLPRYPFGSALLWFLELRCGFDREDFDLETAAGSLGDRPLLVIAGADDVRMPPELQQKVAKASKSPLSRFVRFPGAGHGAAYRVATEDYQKEVLTFLARAGL
jgi:pimeloyl-ACP methyl ester carboxylesterase